MKLNSFLLIILFIVSLTLLTFFFPKKNKIIMGYCPTMAAYIELFDNKDYELKPLTSSAEVLSDLITEKINIGLIGRKAKPQEITKNVVFQQLDSNAKTLVKTIGAADDQAFLLPWKKVNYSQVELVILTNEQGHKLANHRTPFLYYFKQTDEKQVEKITTLIKQKI